MKNLILLLLLLLIPCLSFAGGYKEKDKEMTQLQRQMQLQEQYQKQNQIAEGGDAESLSSSSSSSSNEGVHVDASENSSIENNASNIVLVPNNNTENCLRVWGFAFGQNGESAAFGIPWRSKKCDYEQAADDAFAGGERELGWFWKCQNPNLYKTFKRNGLTNDEAAHECHTKSVGYGTALHQIDMLKAELDILQAQVNHDKEICKEGQKRIHKTCNIK